MYSTILVALDGSEYSQYGAHMAMKLARELGARILACHVYGARLHSTRFRDMEPGLSAQYQDKSVLEDLRQSHDSLISDGLRALSQGYMDQVLTQAREYGVDAVEVTVEGRNYSKILEVAAQRNADLIVAGAYGLGFANDGLLGSVATRLLRHAGCDLLVARRPVSDGLVMVGVDGSDYAFRALRKAAVWSRIARGRLELAAAYDPQFHLEVFKAMARSLSPQRQEEVGLDRQGDLHRQIIDHGLGFLYDNFLREADGLAKKLDVETSSVLLQGKAYRALLDHAARNGADLIVVGRHGHHRDGMSTVGSNAEALVRLAPVNVLVTWSEETVPKDSAQAGEAMEWTPEALKRLERVPSFARSMARRGVEDEVKRKGGACVTVEAFIEAAKRFGMTHEPEGNDG